jgi:hypothetical protein
MISSRIEQLQIASRFKTSEQFVRRISLEPARQESNPVCWRFTP